MSEVFDYTIPKEHILAIRKWLLDNRIVFEEATGVDMATSYNYKKINDAINHIDLVLPHFEREEMDISLRDKKQPSHEKTRKERFAEVRNILDMAESMPEDIVDREQIHSLQAEADRILAEILASKET